MIEKNEDGWQEIILKSKKETNQINIGLYGDAPKSEKELKENDEQCYEIIINALMLLYKKKK